MKTNDKTQATPKAPAIDALLMAITGRSRVDAVDSLTCATCGQDAQNKSFRDPLSWKEYTISGMCQSCQDSVFGVSEE
jgi:hypothetical protein